MPKLRSFLALDGADRIATFEAMGELLLANALVRFVPPRRWRSRFGAVTASASHDRLPQDLATVRRIRLAVARAWRNLPTDPNCLPQALAARRMLIRRGIESQLYIGIARENGGRPRFHAWLKVESEWVTGHCDESHFTLFAPVPADRV